MIFNNASQLSKKVEELRNGKKVVLATGTFDLFHYEHLKYLEGAKEQGDILVVAVKSDKCAKLKGSDRPYIKQMERATIVDAIKYVDFVIIVDYMPELNLEIEAENEK